MPQRILIADDEPLARERLQRLVDSIPDYDVCGEAADGNHVLQAIAECEPDIVLLDIRMPGLDGMDVARQITQLSRPPAVIFCTAFDQYAINAFDVQAIAYLLKPVRLETLTDALARAGRINRVQLQALEAEQRPQPGKLAVRTYRGTVLIDVSSIRSCEADQKCVTLRHSNGETVTDHTLKELESSFPEALIRIHRHTLVGKRFIEAMTRTPAGQYQIQLNDGSASLQVSRRHAGAVREWLQQQGR
ncbi:MAG: DNA-binding response regulator [Alteromonadaceae bacterium]|uniref:LytR/AlgR family response regulator transcription factor n=1 Tax=unclassified Marinobacter TaxID=83889 RepID=UPI000C5F81FA|nr:LytTR family DNA-binding domain-containing protein [Marinobacter sp. BGYM27]MAA66468.1 DNA-binding response regulator [Alteromonadaceae bacterium]MBH85326.1 DNA-binding response regulator [Alteromonadaceae bacterium]MDG5499873.1 LytTR family DNA-binding domain-containing protein [Marinobacter sp. BGYM27]|tara:strand:+ start:14902 stop:15642 length:741 start_codon:yes stop_codon:yes gene_type:complete